MSEVLDVTSQGSGRTVVCPHTIFEPVNLRERTLGLTILLLLFLPFNNFSQIGSSYGFLWSNERSQISGPRRVGG